MYCICPLQSLYIYTICIHSLHHLCTLSKQSIYTLSTNLLQFIFMDSEHLTHIHAITNCAKMEMISCGEDTDDPHELDDYTDSYSPHIDFESESECESSGLG